MKKSTTAMMVFGFVLVSSLAFAGFGLAQGPQGQWGHGGHGWYGGDRGHGGHGCGDSFYGNMERAPQATPEQQAKAQKLHDAYYSATNNVRGLIHEKKAELKALMAALTPDKAKIEAKSQELGVLRGKLNVERAEFMAQLRREGLSLRDCFTPKHMERHGG